jgi:hypothetical protein
MFAQPRTFRCPNCNEMINESMDRCRFCSTPIDHEAAANAAESQDKVNQSCNDASYVRIAAVAMFVFLGLSFIPLIPVVYWGFLVTFALVLVLLVRWQVKFGRLKTTDTDYGRARRSKNVALVLWLVAIPVGFVIRPLWDTITSFLFFR